MEASSWRRLVWVAVAMAAPWSAAGQPQPGVTEKYFPYRPGSSVVDAAYPELSIDDLRRITMYSKLAIGRGQARIADSEYMRSVEDYPGDKELLTVVADHFRFTVLKDGRIPAKALRQEERRTHQSLWIKHATKEEAPDGRPWLKDMILLPYDPRSGDLAGVWPFFDVEQKSGGETVYSAFIAGWDPRPALGGFPGPHLAFFPFDAWTVFEPDQLELWALPNRTDTRRGSLPIFDCHLGGMAPARLPVKRRKY